MNLKHEEQITRYFERQMSSGEEQSFLISLAASDEMRIAFRSHLELMKALRQDKESMTSAVPVRARTFAALGIAASAIPFMDNELRSAPIQQTASVAPAVATKTGLSIVKNFVRSHALGMALGVGVGLGGAMLMDNPSTNVEQPGAAKQSVQEKTYTQPIITSPEEAKAVANDAPQTSSRTVIAIHPRQLHVVTPSIVSEMPKAIAAEQNLPVVEKSGTSKIKIKTEITKPVK